MSLPMWYSPTALVQDNGCTMVDIRYGSTPNAGPCDTGVFISSGIAVPASANQWLRMPLAVPQSFLTYLFVGYSVTQKTSNTTGICAARLQAMTFPGGPGNDTVLNYTTLMSAAGEQRNIPINGYKLGQSLTLFLQIQIADPSDYIVIGDIGIWTESTAPSGK